jgi:hypothetical protein
MSGYLSSEICRMTTAIQRRNLPCFPTLVYDCRQHSDSLGPFSYYDQTMHQDNASMLAALTSGKQTAARIIDFIPKTGVVHQKTEHLYNKVSVLHLSNCISITPVKKMDKNARILLDVSEVLHEVDIAIRVNLNIVVIADIIIGYFNIWFGIPMQKQPSSVISKMPLSFQWWFVADDEEVKSKQDILLEWISKDAKLCQLVKKISKFDTFFTDRYGSYHHQEVLRSVLIIQRQDFDLSQKRWISKNRRYDESYEAYDSSWCCRGSTISKNSLYIENGKLHLSGSSNGCPISREDQEKLYQIGQVTQYMGDEIPKMQRECNLLFSLSELRAIFFKFAGAHEHAKACELITKPS